MRESWNDRAKTIGRLLETPEDGRIKLYLIWRTLCLRRQQPDLFDKGEYLPLAVEGAKADHVIAFVRKAESGNVMVVVPRLVAGLSNDINLPPTGPQIWEDTQVLIPSCDCSKKYQNAFTGQVLDHQTSDGHTKIAVSKILAEFPVALCLLG